VDAVTKKLRWLYQNRPKDFANAIMQMSDDEVQSILYDWNIFGRDNQLPPSYKKWRTWLILAGRGLIYRLTLNLSNSVNILLRQYRAKPFGERVTTSCKAYI